VLLEDVGQDQLLLAACRPAVDGCELREVLLLVL
jgi:hypothetical protein